MQTVVVNGDDFGLNAKTNAAIMTAHSCGVLTSASLMVNEPFAREAVSLAETVPGLAVGLHTVLSCGSSALLASSIPHLAGRDGRFRESPALAGLAAYFGSAARLELRLEVRAQFERFAVTGLPWSHVDGHQHLHMHPVAWDCIVANCKEFGVRCIRVPYEEWIPGCGSVRMVEWLYFRVLRRRCLRVVTGLGLTIADRVYGHLESGRLNEARLTAIFNRLRGATNEIYLHPGAHPQELRALTSDSVRSAASRVRLCTYPELVA